MAVKKKFAIHLQAALSLCAMCFNVVQATLEARLEMRYDSVTGWFNNKLESEGAGGKFLRAVTRSGVKEE